MSFDKPTGYRGARSIKHGWDVFGADGDKVGDVSEVYGNSFLIEKGFLFKTSLYVPFSAVTNVEHDRVYLNVNKNEIESQGWDQMPRDNADYETGTGTTAYDRTRSTGMTTGTTSMDKGMRTDAGMRGSDKDVDHMEVPVVEEQLQARTRDVEKGRVRVHKDVVEEEQTLNVPVREDEVHVQRRSVNDRNVTGDVSANAFKEQDIEIPVYGEEVDVTKRAVVREEVDISKTSRERNKKVSDTVRREEVHVDGEGVDSITDPTMRRGDSDRGTTPL